MPIVKITKHNYSSVVLEASQPVLLDFWADWCGPCQRIAPLIEDLAQSHPELLIGKVNVDEYLELARELGITSIPTLVLVKNGVPVLKQVGACTKAQLLDLVGL